MGDKKGYPEAYKPWMIMTIIVSIVYGAFGIYYVVELAVNMQKNESDDKAPVISDWISLFFSLFICAFGIFGAVAVKKMMLKIFFVFNLIMLVLGLAEIIFYAVMTVQCNNGKKNEEEGFWDYMCSHIPGYVFAPLSIQVVLAAFGTPAGFMGMKKSKEEKKDAEGTFF